MTTVQARVACGLAEPLDEARDNLADLSQDGDREPPGPRKSRGRQGLQGDVRRAVSDRCRACFSLRATIESRSNSTSDQRSRGTSPRRIPVGAGMACSSGAKSRPARSRTRPSRSPISPGVRYKQSREGGGLRVVEPAACQDGLNLGDRAGRLLVRGPLNCGQTGRRRGVRSRSRWASRSQGVSARLPNFFRKLRKWTVWVSR